MPVRAIQVVKVGGSLVGEPARFRAVLSDLAEQHDVVSALVPGGGPFADAVRDTQRRLGFDDRLAHRLALDAMTAMAEVIQTIEPRLALASSVTELRASLREDRPSVWAPRDLRAGHLAIRESWDVTSDSLALWLAAELGAARCILFKSADAPADAEADSLTRSGFVDAAFPGFAAKFAGHIVLQGPHRKVELARTPLAREAAA